MRLITKLGIAAGLALVALVGTLGMQQATGNLHEVVPGVMYRSGQLEADRLERVAAEFGIRSVLNLRGAAPGAEWYDRERAVSAAAGIVHADFVMNSREILPEDRAARLIALMRDLPKPILIHCEHGSDRSGLASALYLAAVSGAGEEEAEGQLSIAFGHFSVPWLSGTWPMDESFERLEPMLGFAGS
jgi:protein tyrosine/serine phosphatase